MIDSRAQKLSDGYDFQSRLMHRFADGISHDESVLPPPFPANCMNWTLGHMLSSRNEALVTLEQMPLWNDSIVALYRTGSEPITDGNRARPFDALLADIDRSNDMLRIALGSSSADYLDQIIETRFGPRPRVEHVDGLQWHENFHLGQLDILRAMILDRR